MNIQEQSYLINKVLVEYGIQVTLNVVMGTPFIDPDGSYDLVGFNKAAGTLKVEMYRRQENGTWWPDSSGSTETEVKRDWNTSLIWALTCSLSGMRKPPACCFDILQEIQEALGLEDTGEYGLMRVFAVKAGIPVVNIPESEMSEGDLLGLPINESK